MVAQANSLVLPIADFFKPKLQTLRAVILGKGRSLDRYEAHRHQQNAFVIGCKEAAEVQPVHAGLTLEAEGKGKPFDTIDIPADTLLLRSSMSITQHANNGVTYVFDFGEQKDEANFVPRYGGGAAVAALTILGMWGKKQILMVGFDSFKPTHGGGDVYDYAECVKPRLRMTQQESGVHRAYRFINEHLLEVEKMFKMELFWFHRCPW